MRDYNLPFIDNADLYRHVSGTLNRFTMEIDLEKFNRNVIDPIKLTFEMHAYRQSPEEVVAHEIARQLGKTVENAMGWFHQNIFRYIDGWTIPENGVDLVNSEKTIFCEMKNKFNTMNSGSAKSVFDKLHGIIIGLPDATTYLVEVIARKSQDEEWHIAGYNLTPEKASRIRKISIDRFYKLATGCDDAFARLCSSLGMVIDDVIAENPKRQFRNTVISEIEAKYPNIVKGIFMSSFATYCGFGQFGNEED